MEVHVQQGLPGVYSLNLVKDLGGSLDESIVSTVVGGSAGWKLFFLNLVLCPAHYCFVFYCPSACVYIAKD